MADQSQTLTTHDSALQRSIKDFTAGWVSGIAQVLVGQPFDTVKVRLQTQPAQVPPLYSGPLDCLKQTIQKEGVPGLYRGTLGPLLGIGLCVSIQFATLEASKRAFLRVNKESGAINPETLSSYQLFIAGTVSGLANTIVAGPVEHVRIRCQVISQGSGAGGQKAIAQAMGMNVFSGPIACARQILATHGIKGLFQGIGATMLRDGMGFGAYFLAYEYMVQKAISRHREKSPNFQRSQMPAYEAISFGALAGVSYWLPVYPIDVIKSKIQTDTLISSERKYPGILRAISRTYSDQGLAGFFRGFTPCMLRSVPVNAATFAAFELAMRYLG